MMDTGMHSAINKCNIVILSREEHPQFDAIGKCYCYSSSKKRPASNNYMKQGAPAISGWK
jgi:hypothetical protein